jgi:hypothetical protein
MPRRPCVELLDPPTRRRNKCSLSLRIHEIAIVVNDSSPQAVALAGAGAPVSLRWIQNDSGLPQGPAGRLVAG